MRKDLTSEPLDVLIQRAKSHRWGKSQKWKITQVEELESNMENKTR